MTVEGTTTWIVGSTQQVSVNLVGYGDDIGYTDVYIYRADDEALMPLMVLASGAEMTSGSIQLEFLVPISLQGFPSLKVRAIEYSHGYDVRSAAFGVGVSYAPSMLPSKEPTPSPPSYSPSSAPTIAPTLSTLSVNIVESTTLAQPPTTLILNSTSLDFNFAYTGSLAHNIQGFVTLRLCAVQEGEEDHSVAYNGPAVASPYESCKTLETILWAAPLISGKLQLVMYRMPTSLESQKVYFRVDSMADRDALGSWAEQWSAYTLVYTSIAYSLSDYTPSSTPSYAPTASISPVPGA